MRSPISRGCCSAGGIAWRSPTARRAWCDGATSTISWSGRRSASCSAAGSAMCCSTSSAYYLAHPIEALYLWHGGMSFHGGALGVTLAIWLFYRAREHPAAGLRRHHLRGGADRAVLRPDRQFHQRRAVRARDRRALGDGVSRTAGRCRAIRASFTRPLCEGLLLFLLLFVAERGGARRHPGMRQRPVPRRLRGGADVGRAVPPARCAARLPDLRHDDGTAAVDPAAARRRSC